MKYCVKCHMRRNMKNIDDVVTDISKELNVDVEKVDCLSYCGPGKHEVFLCDDEVIYSAGTMEDLIEKVKKNDF